MKLRKLSNTILTAIIICFIGCSPIWITLCIIVLLHSELLTFKYLHPIILMWIIFAVAPTFSYLSFLEKE